MRLTINPQALEHPLLLEWTVRMTNEKADEILADLVLHDMREKLAKKRREGYGGWHTASASNDDLMARLKRHISKGDMIDVINFAAMIHARAILFGEPTIFSDEIDCQECGRVHDVRAGCVE